MVVADPLKRFVLVVSISWELLVCLAQWSKATAAARAALPENVRDVWLPLVMFDYL